MISSIDELKKERPDLVNMFGSMNREELLKSCYLEAIDAINMENRVAVFMAECTDNMSDTTYTIESIKDLINQKKEREISQFCYDVCNNNSNNDILEEIKAYAENYRVDK